jgi:hypothetical protein
MPQLSNYSPFPVNDSISAAEILASKVPETLSSAAKLLYTVLVATAVETARGRGYSPSVTHVSLHMPLIILADVCGMHRVTAWRHLPALRELGLVDYVSHKGTLRGEIRNTGTLFEIRLNPSAGTKARLSYHEKKHKWRDLDKDVRRKRTAFRMLKARDATVSKTSTKELDISRLLEWTLKPDTGQNPVTSYGCTAEKVSLEALLDVKNAPREERNTMVALAAQAMAQALNDAKSNGWYQKLLWQLLRRADATGDDYSYQVYLMAVRARTDHLEGFARHPGALFVSRLKQADFYDWIMGAPPNRVGTRPN